VNYDDLHDALKTGKIGGVALESNHTDIDHPLLSDARVYVCPRAADATEISYRCMSKLVASNIMRAVQGEGLVDVVDVPAVEGTIAGENYIGASTVPPISPTNNSDARELKIGEFRNQVYTHGDQEEARWSDWD
jgi:hypothetical protein